ncbi:MAG: type III glutamate--ammonia ligase [Gemmobacter sp.]|jgi:glutamine synthetase|nr:type III glutamate--ammonia ligase [Gemmobacter sp.]
MSNDLAKWAKDRGVKYFLVSFTDLVGFQRAKLVPAQSIGDVTKNGAGFAGFAAGFIVPPSTPDMLGTPDADTVIQLPWKPEVAWLASNCSIDGKSLEQAPRNILVRLVEEAAKDGLRIKTGVEPEFFFLSPDGHKIADPLDVSKKPCYDQQAIMRRYDVIAEVCDYMLDLGWGPYQSDHEDANGQFEMNWKFDDALKTADKLAFFKFMMRSVAEKHGLRVTFMAKPFIDLTGSGLHAHVSGWSLDGKTNTFADESRELGLSQQGRNFLAGVMKHAPGSTAIQNPTVNSYKRLNAPTTASGATWAPSKVTWSGDNRTHYVRVPGGRMELRSPDSSNPYLLHAVIIAAGLDGVRNKLEPADPLYINMAVEGHTVKDATRLPLNLLDALRAYEADSTLRGMLGEDFSEAYLALKHKEWHSYVSHMSSWEIDNYVDV